MFVFWYFELFEYWDVYAQSAFIHVRCCFFLLASDSNSFYIGPYIFCQLLSTLPSNIRIHLHKMKSPPSTFSALTIPQASKRYQMWSMCYKIFMCACVQCYSEESKKKTAVWFCGRDEKSSTQNPSICDCMFAQNGNGVRLLVSDFVFFNDPYPYLSICILLNVGNFTELCLFHWLCTAAFRYFTFESFFYLLFY